MFFNGFVAVVLSSFFEYFYLAKFIEWSQAENEEQLRDINFIKIRQIDIQTVQNLINNARREANGPSLSLS